MEPDANREWHLEIDGVRKGPVSERRLLSDRELGLLDDSSLVWTESFEDWVALGSLSFGDKSADHPTSTSPDSEEPVYPSDPIVKCVWSGEERPQSEMLPFGEVWIAPEHREVFVQNLAETGTSPDIPMEGFPFPTTLSLDTVLGQSFRIFSAQWKAILILCLAIHGPTQLVMEVISRHFLWAPEIGDDAFGMSYSLTLYSIWGPVLLGLGSIILVGSFVAASLYAMTCDRWKGRSELEAGTLLRSGLENFPRVLLTRLFLHALYLIAGATLSFLAFQSFEAGAFLILLAFVIVGGLSIRLHSGEAIAVLEGRGGSWALGRSWQLTRRNFWRITGYRLLVYLPIGAIGVLSGFLLEIPVPILQNFVVAALVSTILTIPTAFASVFEMILAIHLQAKESDQKEEPPASDS